MKKLIVAIMALTVVFTIAACSQKEEPTPAATSTPSTSAAATASPGTSATPASSSSKELKITATNWKFDQTEYKVKAGETYKVTLTSTDGVHGIKANGDLKLNVGANKTVDFKFDKAGTYEIECSIPCGNGHTTMKAKIVVEA